MLSRRAKALFYFLAGPLMLCNATTYRLIRAPRKGYVRAHLGPGQQNYTEGSINVDANMFTAKCDVWADLRNKLPFHDVDRNLKGLTWWTNKHNKFTTRQMLDFLNLEYGFSPADRSLDKCSSAQTRLKRFLRNQIFARAPLWVRGLLYFFLRYFLRLGFLDGPEGFVFHFLQGLCNWILIDAKIDEARRFMALRGLEAFKAHLKSRHGIDHVPAAPRSDAVAI